MLKIFNLILNESRQGDGIILNLSPNDIQITYIVQAKSEKLINYIKCIYYN